MEGARVTSVTFLDLYCSIQYCSGGHIKEVKKDGACGTHAGGKGRGRHFGEKV